MFTLPILLNNPCIIILGGGAVALQKATVLRKHEIPFSLISQRFCSEFESFDQKKTIKIIEEIDLVHYNIIVDATGSDAVGRMLENVQKKRYILLNRVDKPQQCNFYFSSLLRYGSLKVAVSTDGSSPTIGQMIRSRIDALLPNGLQKFIDQVKIQRTNGYIDPLDTRNKLQKLFTQVFLIECHDVMTTLNTLDHYFQLLKLDAILYQQYDCYHPIAEVKCKSNLEHNAVDCSSLSSSCEQIYTELQGYYNQGKTIGVLIPTDDLKYFMSHLNDDGVSFEVVSQFK